MEDLSTAAPSGSPARPPGWGPLREVWSIAWPTVLTMTSYTIMQFMDKLMVGQVGPLEVAAQGNGGIWSFTPIAFALGFLTVVNTWVSQNLGAGTPRNGAKYAWAAIWMSLGVWLVALVPLAVLLPSIFELIHGGEAVAERERLIALESGYARILLGAGVILLAARGMHNYFFGLHRPKIVTISAIAGNVANVVFNYVLIFGEGGMPALGLPGVPGVPALGIYGAAIGTVIGTAVELAIPLALFLGPKMNEELDTRSPWRPALGPIRDLVRIGWPAGVQFGNEVACWAIFMTVLVGVFGEDHMTAGWIALGYMHLSFMPAIGFSVAVTSLVGKYVGAGRPEVAVARVRLGVALAVAYMTVCGILFYALRGPLVSAFVGGNADAEQAARIVEIGSRLLICIAVIQTVDAFGIVYVGGLRGAGDTVWPGIMTVILSWTLVAGGGWLMLTLFPGLESLGPWIASAAYIAAFAAVMARRFESGAWRSIRLLEEGGPAVGMAAEAVPIALLAAGPPAPGFDGEAVDPADEENGETGRAPERGLSLSAAPGRIRGSTFPEPDGEALP